jgi:hypothetical protein
MSAINIMHQTKLPPTPKENKSQQMEQVIVHVPHC